ncbi:MAG TPA: DUF2284 domain-containing protein [Candidatus Acidoferrales bacterium]
MKTNPPPLWYVLGLPEPQADISPNGCAPLAEFALRQGAAAAVPIAPVLIAVSEQVRYKCQYGCGYYQRNKMCPPHTPPVAEFRQVVQRYNHALLVRAAPEKLHELILQIEREAFLQGHALALGLIEGHCSLCEKCPGPNAPCLQPEKARPAMEAMGIDVFRTCANADIELRIIADPTEPYLAIGLVLF